jgi:rhodanese-related sulfurtransferase
VLFVANLKRIGIILLISGTVAGVANSVHPRKIPWAQDWSRHVEDRAAKQSIKMIPLSVALVRHQENKSLFIDARPTDEFNQGHIPDARSIPFESLEEHFSVLVELIDSDRELAVYCKNRECDDAYLLAIELQAMGGSNLVLYVDGFELWEEHGGAVEQQP